MKRFLCCIVLMLCVHNLIAQEDELVASSGSMSSLTFVSGFAKRAEVCYEFPRTTFLASLFIYHSDIKVTGDVNKVDVMHYFLLRDISVPKLVVAFGMDGRDFKYVWVDSGIFMSNYSEGNNLPNLKIHTFAKHDIQYNKTVPMVMIVNKNAKIPDDLLNRVLQCTNVDNISKNDLEVLQKETTVCEIFSYKIFK